MVVIGGCVRVAGDEFEVVGELGEGSFGTVWRCRSARGQVVALKEMKAWAENKEYKYH